MVLGGQIIRKPGSVLANHLSSSRVTPRIKRVNDELWRDTNRFSRHRSISLQQTGFTSSKRHRLELWAFTPLVSPLPRQARKFRFCGTFPRVTPGRR